MLLMEFNPVICPKSSCRKWFQLLRSCER